ncbi:phage tail tape measure protein [Kitasatospora sp. NPDC056800]|uniref:phage tail tape measure protein n=1 Tax=Kitasatospora sp. NPDC056800 TaxID=3345948 RepID=UPI0036777C15
MTQVADATGRAVDAVIESATQGTTDLTQTVTGRLRDSRGRFVSAGEALGDAAGDAIAESTEQATEALGQGIEGRLRDARGRFTAAGETVGEAGGQAVTDAVENAAQTVGEGLGGGLRDARGRFAAAGRDVGEEGGQAVADGVEAGAQDLAAGVEGEMRDARGRFVSQGKAAGEEGGQSLSQGLLSKGAIMVAGVAAIALKAGEALADGLSKAMDQEKGISKLQAQLGTTPQMAQEFGNIAGRLYGQAYGESVGDATNAVKEVWQSGLLPADATSAEIEKISGSAMALAETFDQDVKGTANAAAQMVRTGLAKNGQEALDILTKGFQQGNDKADDLLDTMVEYGTQFRNVGIDGSQAMGLISQGLKAGARDADVVADTIKEFSIEAVAGSDKIRGGYEKVGLNADRMFAAIGKGGASANDALAQTFDALRKIEDPIKRNAVATELFGTKAEDMGAALYALDPRTATQAMGDFAGAAGKLGDTLHDNSSTRIEQFKRGLEQGFVNFIGGSVLPVLERFGNVIVSTFGPVFSAAIDTVRLFFGTFTGEGASTDLSSGWINKVIEAGATARNIYDNVTSSVRSFISTLTAEGGPVSGTIEVMRGAFDRFSAVIRDQVIPWAEALWPKIAPVIENLKNTVYVGFEYIHAVFATTIAVIEAIWSRWGDNILRVATAFVGQVMGVIGGFLDIVRGLWEMAIGLLTGDWDRFWKGVTDIAAGIGRVVVSTVKGTWDMVYGAFKGPIDSMTNTFDSAMNWLKNGWQNVKDWFSRNLSFDFGGMWDGIFNAFKAAVNKVIRGWNGLEFTIGGGSVFGVDIPSFTLGTPKIPLLAAGGNVLGSGAAIIGEAGPELLQLPTGARVTPLTGSQRGLSGASEPQAPTVIVNVSVAGSVATERDLARSIAASVRDEIIRIGNRNGGRTGFGLQA